MTNQEQMITPPFELMNQWFKKACKDPYNGGKFIMAQTLKDFANSASQWGANQELDACVEWVSNYCPYFGDFPLPEDKLRTARRPKPPSLKEQALEALNQADEGLNESEWQQRSETIRRALEQLND